MKKRLFPQVFFLLLCTVVWISVGAVAAGVDMPPDGQNIYFDQERKHEQGAYFDFQVHGGRKQIESSFLDVKEGRFEDNLPELPEPFFPTEGDNAYNQEPPLYFEEAKPFPKGPLDEMEASEFSPVKDQHNDGVPEQSPDASPVYPEIERQYNKQQLELSPLPELPVGEPPYAKQPASYQDSGAGQDANLPEPGVAEPGLDRRSAS